MNEHTTRAIHALRACLPEHTHAALIVRDVMGHCVGLDISTAYEISGYEVIGWLLPDVWPMADERSVGHALAHGPYVHVGGNVHTVPTPAQVIHAVSAWHARQEHDERGHVAAPVEWSRAAWAGEFA